jgi:hypothetical protein
MEYPKPSVLLTLWSQPDKMTKRDKNNIPDNNDIFFITFYISEEIGDNSSFNSWPAFLSIK